MSRFFTSGETTATDDGRPVRIIIITSRSACSPSTNGSGGDKQGGPGDGRDSEAQSGDRDEPEDTEDEPVQKPENENSVPDTLPGTAQSEAKDAEGKAPPTPGGGAPIQSKTDPGGSNPH